MYMDYGYKYIFVIYTDVYINGLWISGYICNICGCIHVWISNLRIYLQYIRMYTYMDYGYLHILQKYGCINIWITDISIYLQYIRMYTYMDYGYQDIFAIYTDVYIYELWILGYICNICECIHIWISDLMIYLQYKRMYTYMDYGYQDIFAIYTDVA